MENFFSKAYADTLYQPVDSDLTAIAALSTTVFGRALLALADAAALRSAIDFAEAVDDEVANLLIGTANEVTVTYNDAANTLTVGLGANVPRLNAASNAFTGAMTVGGNVESSAAQPRFGRTNTHWLFSNPTLDAAYFQQLNGGPAGPFLIRNGGICVEQTCYVGIGGSNYASTNPDVRFVRNATGPTAETRAAGGLRVCNADGSALSLLSCGSIRLGTGTTVQNILSATATLDFPSIPASSFADLTITVTGAVSGDTVIVNPIAGSATNDVVYTGWVSAANTVTIRASNVSSTTARDPASGTFRATVVRF